MQNEAYLGLPIFRFYIKCTRCLAEITFKVDAGRAGPAPSGAPRPSSPRRESPFHFIPRKQAFWGVVHSSIVRKGGNAQATHMYSNEGLGELVTIR